MATKITNAQHFKNAKAIYEEKGQGAVFTYANKNNIGYEFCKACDTDSPSIKHICLVCGQETAEKKTYVVAVCRTSYAFRDVEVKASTEKEALELAIDKAGDFEFSEKSADYTTDGLREKS